MGKKVEDNNWDVKKEEELLPLHDWIGFLKTKEDDLRSAHALLWEYSRENADAVLVIDELKELCLKNEVAFSIDGLSWYVEIWSRFAFCDLNKLGSSIKPSVKDEISRICKDKEKRRKEAKEKREGGGNKESNIIEEESKNEEEWHNGEEKLVEFIVSLGDQFSQLQRICKFFNWGLLLDPAFPEREWEASEAAHLKKLGYTSLKEASKITKKLYAGLKRDLAANKKKRKDGNKTKILKVEIEELQRVKSGYDHLEFGSTFIRFPQRHDIGFLLKGVFVKGGMDKKYPREREANEEVKEGWVPGSFRYNGSDCQYPELDDYREYVPGATVPGVVFALPDGLDDKFRLQDFFEAASVSCNAEKVIEPEGIEIEIEGGTPLVIIPCTFEASRQLWGDIDFDGSLLAKTSDKIDSNLKVVALQIEGAVVSLNELMLATNTFAKMFKALKPHALIIGFKYPKFQYRAIDIYRYVLRLKALRLSRYFNQAQLKEAIKKGETAVDEQWNKMPENFKTERLINRRKKTKNKSLTIEEVKSGALSELIPNYSAGAGESEGRAGPIDAAVDEAIDAYKQLFDTKREPKTAYMERKLKGGIGERGKRKISKI